MRNPVLGLLGLCSLLILGSAHALTNGGVEVRWTPTTDPTVRYELRWQHFANGWVWQSIATDLDSTTGAYPHTFSPLPDTPGDRGACWDARAVRGTSASKWLSELGQQVCLQLPVSVPVVLPPPTPEPPPVPVPMDPATVTMSGDKIFIQCDPTRYMHAKTTGTGNKRTITCLP